MSRRILIALSRSALIPPFVAVAACDVVPPSPTAPASAVAGSATSLGAGSRPQFAAEIFIDYGVPAGAASAPTPTQETSDYSLLNGGIHWESGGTVSYSIAGPEDAAGGNTAIEASVATLDGFITTRALSRVPAGSESANPCGGGDVITWASIDGPGSVLAVTAVCRNVATKEIVGFTITIDTAETWSTNAAAGTFDVANTMTHEAGHVAGLGHDNAPKAGCLTMYKYASTAEIQKRTLGWGDKLGLQALYSSSDTTAGSCGS